MAVGSPSLRRPAGRRELPGGELWANHDFVKFWAGQSVSALGNYATLFALPTLAILALGAGSQQVGVLRGLRVLPVALLALAAGALTDRIRRKRLALAITDLARAALLLSVPAAVWLGFGSLPLLYGVSLLMGISAAFFTTTERAFLPALTGRDHLYEGNQKLVFTDTSAQFFGYSAAGYLVQLLGAVVGLLVDAVSFVVSALSLLWLRSVAEPEAEASAQTLRTLPAELAAGFQAIWSHPIVRAMALSLVFLNFSTAMRDSVYLLFAYRRVGISPAEVGTIFAAGGAFATVGAAVSLPLRRRLGLGPVLILTTAGASICLGLLPLAAVLREYAFWVLLALQAGFAIQVPIVNVNQATYAQAALPPQRLGRAMGAAMTVTMGSIPLGALLGGVLGDWLGLAPVLVASGAAAGLGCVLYVLGPVRAVRE